MTDHTLLDRIASLDETGLKLVYGRLLMELEAETEPALTEAEQQRHHARDRELLNVVAQRLQITAAPLLAEREAMIRLLTIVATTFPEYRAVIVDAIEE